MDIGIAEVRKSEKKHWGAESNIEGAELSIGGGAEGHPKSIQIDTSVHYYRVRYAAVLSSRFACATIVFIVTPT